MPLKQHNESIYLYMYSADTTEPIVYSHCGSRHLKTMLEESEMDGSDNIYSRNTKKQNKTKHKQTNTNIKHPQSRRDNNP